MTCTTAEELAAEEAAKQLMMRQAAQREAITNAITAAETAVAAVDNDATDAEVTEADAAVMAVRSAIAAAADLPMTETDANTGTANALANRLTAAKTARTAYMDKMQSDADKAMMATAMKLHAGIAAPTSESPDPATGTRFASYGTGENANNIRVRSRSATDIFLTEDKKTTVAALHGWTGKRYHRTTPASAGTYEAHVYSNIGAPEQGNKFGQVGIETPATGYQYGLNAQGVLTTDVESGTSAPRVDSSRFDQSAGVKQFAKGSNEVAVMISGTYHGVSGTYSCTPSGNNICAAQKAAEGFNLGGVTSATNAATFAADNAAWTFKPSNPEARVMSTPDAIYASYGWWLHTAANGDLTASAFVSDKGEVPNAAGLDSLQGTATYMGGAAGKYALYSSTGGTNDAGHFTARATLEADFGENSITGTIDQFMGVGGAKNWSVELKEAVIAGEGGISRSAADDTVWTIGGTAAAASGEWSGSLQDNGADGVPKVGTGTFYTTYGNDGRMVGAFGVTKQ